MVDVAVFLFVAAMIAGMIIVVKLSREEAAVVALAMVVFVRT